MDEQAVPEGHAVIELIASSDWVVGFDAFVQQATGLVDMSFVLVPEPEGDVAPFAVIAEGPDMYEVKWRDIDLDLESPDYVERFLDEILPASLVSRDPELAALYLTMYLTDPDGRRFEAAVLSVLATDGHLAREQSLAAEIRRSPDGGPELDDWQVIDDHIAPAIARSLSAAMFDIRQDRGPSAGPGPRTAELFREFVEERVPAALAGAIEHVRDEWDGSPWLILATPEAPQFDFFIIESEAGIEQLNEICESARRLADPPVAAALVFSGPLFTSTGMNAGEGMLTILAVDDHARRSTRFRRLHTDAAGRAAVDEVPPDVQPQVMPGVTHWFMTELLGLCGAIRRGEVDADSEAWNDLLDDARDPLGRKAS